MQQSQRAECNHALEYAVQQANDAGLPLLVAFGLMDDYPEANARHYRFMLEGLQETQQALERRKIKMVVQHGNPADVAVKLAAKAGLVVCDRGYLRHQKAWRRTVAEDAPCEVVQIEGDVVVPVEVVSGKAEYAARTLRPKLHKYLEDYLVDLSTTPLGCNALSLGVGGMDLGDLNRVVRRLRLDHGVPPVTQFFRGGTGAARRLLDRFLDKLLPAYQENRNQPQTDYTSHLSKYLHFGQISPIYVAVRGRQARRAPRDERAAFLEELLVRRELSMNFVHYTKDYDSFRCLPEWAKNTLRDHADDPREQVYTKQQLEDAATHDPYWNAATREMRYTGYMHNYMRMYWGKKILEWTNTPEYAYRVALELNNKYFLDGRDANSYAGVGWVFGLHDRPWQRRPIFGTVRYMSASGLERKSDIQAYVEKVGRLVDRSRASA
jgi:deoxyribodipyrimidine photo-lyase